MENANILDYLERDFQQVINEMANDQSLEKFRKEYLKLFDKLRQSHIKEKELLMKSKELTRHISDNAAKIKNMISMAQNDAMDITKLKSELGDARNILVLQKERDNKAKTTIEHLSQMWKNLYELTNKTQSSQSEKIKWYKGLIENKKVLND